MSPLYVEQLNELRRNLFSLSALNVNLDTVAVSDSGSLVGESSPNAKYTDNDLINCIDLRLEGMSLKSISKKMDIPIRTLRDVFSGRRRSVMPIRFKAKSAQAKKKKR